MKHGVVPNLADLQQTASKLMRIKQAPTDPTRCLGQFGRLISVNVVL